MLTSSRCGTPATEPCASISLYDLLDGPEPPEDLAESAVEVALAETRDAHQAVWGGLGRNERLVLVALSDGQAPTGSVIADEHRVARSTLQQALDRLLRDGLNLHRNDEGSPVLLDPLFAEWLRRR